MMSRITLNLRKAGRLCDTQTIMTATVSYDYPHRPKRDSWLLSLFPGLRQQSILQLWERGSLFHQFSYYDNSTNTCGGATQTEPRLELGEEGQQHQISGFTTRPRRNSLGIRFADPDAVMFEQEICTQ
jgi:hypothetical protein